MLISITLSPQSIIFLFFLHKGSGTQYHPGIVDQLSTSTLQLFSPLDLNQQLTLSEPFIFIQYLPEKTIRPRWYVIEIRFSF